jgi:hypothetical protein
MRRGAFVMSLVALVVAIAAAAMAAYAAFLRSDKGSHRCGGFGGSEIACVSNDTPREIRGRSCAPGFREKGVVHWFCRSAEH